MLSALVRDSEWCHVTFNSGDYCA